MLEEGPASFNVFKVSLSVVGVVRNFGKLRGVHCNFQILAILGALGRPHLVCRFLLKARQDPTARNPSNFPFFSLSPLRPLNFCIFPKILQKEDGPHSFSSLSFLFPFSLSLTLLMNSSFQVKVNAIQATPHHY